MSLRRGRITRIERSHFQTCSVTTAVKANEQPEYDNNPRYVGSNGTYYHNFQSENYYTMYATIYSTEDKPEMRIEIDIKQGIYDQSGCKRISPQHFDRIKLNNEGKKIWFDVDEQNGRVGIAPGQLNLM